MAAAWSIPDAIRRAIQPSTKLISVMHANNEVGTIQPIAEIARIAAEAGIPLHSDGVQAVGKIPVSVADLGVAMYSISGHKIGAPKGVGALYVRKGTSLKPMMFGGRHERERRAGTENVAGAVALGRAAEWIAEHGDAENRRQGALARSPGAKHSRPHSGYARERRWCAARREHHQHSFRRDR